MVRFKCSSTDFPSISARRSLIEGNPIVVQHAEAGGLAVDLFEFGELLVAPRWLSAGLLLLV
jgi:hypothetical protein